MQVKFVLKQNNQIAFKSNSQKIAKKTIEKAAIFDLDGVCIDSIKPHYEAWSEFCKRHNLPFSQQIFRKDFLAGTNTEHMKRLFSGATDQQIVKFVKEREDIFAKNGEQFTHVIDGFVDFVKSIRNVTDKIGIVTSSTLPHVKKAMGMFEEKGLENPESFFPVVINGSMVTKGKPNPEGYIKAIKKLDVTAENCVGFEDSRPGIEALLNADIKNVVALATSHTPEELCKMKQDNMVKHIMSNFKGFSAADFLKLTNMKNG